MNNQAGAYWNGDGELFRLMQQELFTAVVGDIMDQLGLLHQFLDPAIQPLRQGMTLAGRAMPVLEADIYPSPETPLDDTLANKPFGLMLEALDDLKENEIYICTGSQNPYALWGELMSTRALKLGAGGAVVDGFSRDTNGILALDFPTFCKGRYAKDQGPRGKVIDFRCTITMNDVVVHPGDIVFGDIDGVCIIPQTHEKEIITLALEKANGEKKVQQAIQQGMSACEAFDKFGIM